MSRRAEQIESRRGNYDSWKLDAGIDPVVRILNDNGVETYESCEGIGKKYYKGEHSYPEPTVRFFGERGTGFHALSIALAYAMPVSSLRRIWQILDGEPVGPDWEMTFIKTRLDEWIRQRAA